MSKQEQRSALIRERRSTYLDPVYIPKRPSYLSKEEYDEVMAMSLDQLQAITELDAKELLEKMRLNDERIRKEQEALTSSVVITEQPSEPASLTLVDDETLYLSSFSDENPL